VKTMDLKREELLYYNYIHTTSDVLVSKTPVFLCSVIITPHSGERGTFRLYDGESTGDPMITEIATGSGVTKVVQFQHDLLTKRGLFVNLFGDIDHALIIYHVDKP